ncbi:MAG: Ig-like domain-containing protein [Solobacterium sp.]|nr:Ig-like domain-containing protein [Solobacterium sp.]
MLKKSNRLLTIFMAFFMCFNSLVIPVAAEGEDSPEVTEEPVIEVVEEPSEEEAEEQEEDILEQVLCWNGSYAETLEGCPAESDDQDVRNDKTTFPDSNNQEKTNQNETKPSEEIIVESILEIDETEESTLMSWEDLQQLINSSENNSTISLDSDIIFPENSSPLTIESGKTLTINLNGYTINRALTEPAEEGSVFVVNGTLTVNGDGGVITGGNTTGNGGGFLVDGGKLTLNNVTVSGNSAEQGGGIAAYGSSTRLTLTNAHILNNSAVNYGGILLGNNGTYTECTMNGGEISGNTAETDGGGIGIGAESVFNFRSGSITNNTAGNHGGGIWMGNRASVLELVISAQTEISGNTAETGGGIYAKDYAVIQLKGGTVTGNAGGGIWFEGNSELKVSGSPKVTDNVKEELSCNICPAANVPLIQVAATLDSTAELGVTTLNKPAFGQPVRITKNLSGRGSAESFISDEDYVVTLNENNEAELNVHTQTITFLANDGSGNETTQLVEKGVSSELEDNSFTRSGFAFKEWNTKADGSGVIYANQQDVTLTEDLTLYAQWEEVYEYHVTFDANGGRFPVPEFMWEFTISSGAAIGQSFGAIHDTKTFIGYKICDTDGNELTTLMNPVLVKLFVPESDVVVRAVWGHRVMVHMGDDIAHVVCLGNSIDNSDNPEWTFGNMTGDFPVFIEEGRTGNFILIADSSKPFLGWATTPNATSLEFTTESFADMEFTQDYDLYPVWGEDGYVVSVDATQFGSYEILRYRMPNYLQEYRQTVEIGAEKGSPLHIGWTAISDAGIPFAGYTTQEGSNIVNYTPYEIAGGAFIPAEDTTLYALYGEVIHVTVNFDNGTSENLQYRILKNTPLDLSMYFPMKENCLFTGYILNESPYNGEPITEDAIITATWMTSDAVIDSLGPIELNVESSSTLELEDTFTVTKADGESVEIKVNWDDPDPAMYKKEGGTFIVTGTVEGTDITVEASVTVAPAQVNTVEDLGRIYYSSEDTAENGLPQTVAVTWSNGEISEEPVTWEVNGELQQPGEHTVTGSFKDLYGNDNPVTLNVVTIEGEDDTIWTEKDKGDVTREDAKTVDYQIPEGLWTVSVPAGLYYTGSVIKPEFRVYDGKILLKAGTDYTVKYYNNKNAGSHEFPDAEARRAFKPAKKEKKPYVLVTGKGNYSGKIYIPFDILPINLNDDVITVDPLSVQATGKTLSPSPAIYFNGKKLKNKTDFTVNYGTVWDKKTAGSYTIAIVGKGNYTGIRAVNLSVAEKGTQTAVSKLSVTVKGITYKDNMNFETDILPTLTVKSGKTALVLDTDYTVNDIPAIDKIGTYSFTITGQGKYIGERKVTFKVTGINLAGKSVKGSVSGTYIYDGTEQEPDLSTISLTNNKTPIDQANYRIVSYKNNKNAGKASVVVEGINAAYGKKTLTFKIAPKTDITAENVHIDPVEYSKGGAKPAVVIEGLTQGTDYTVKYTYNKKVGTGYATITFKGNYKGTPVIKNVPFTITQKSFSMLMMSTVVQDVVYSSKAGKYKSVPVITDTDGKKLKAGTDFTILGYMMDGRVLDSKEVIPAKSRVTVIYQGKGNYTDDTVAKEYWILPSGYSVAKMKVTVKTQEYTGKEIQVTGEDFTFKSGKKTVDLTLGQDYIIAGYTNNVKKGTATVTIEGIGEYGGTKTVKFKIGQRSVISHWQGIFQYFNQIFDKN